MEVDDLISELREILERLNAQGFRDEQSIDFMRSSLELAYLSHKGIIK